MTGRTPQGTISQSSWEYGSSDWFQSLVTLFPEPTAFLFLKHTHAGKVGNIGILEFKKG